MLKPKLVLACKYNFQPLCEYQWAQGSQMVQNKMLTCSVGVMLRVLAALLHNHSARESLNSKTICVLLQYGTSKGYEKIK